MKRESHSDKGLKTIELMGTKADQWTLTPIKWKKVKMVHPMKMDCPDCWGKGRTYVNNATGKWAADATFENINDHKPNGWRSKNTHGECPRCKNLRTGQGSGQITKMVEQLVMVGIPVWAKNTLFDSRFSQGIYDDKRHQSEKNVHSGCDLCSKSIHGIWSFTVPIQAKGDDGRIHGMWVGQDCAKKVLGIELLLTPGQKEDMKFSEIKNWRVMEKLP